MTHSQLTSLASYLGDARRLDQTGFVNRNPGSYLLLCVTPHAELLGTSEFHTAVMDPQTTDVAKFALCDEYRVLSLVKAPGNPWSERISVGRARNNDVVIRLPSVSKLHGHFVVRDGDLYFNDVGSKNGSKLNNDELSQRESHQVHDGDALLLGHVEVVLRTTAGLYEFLQTFL